MQNRTRSEMAILGLTLAVLIFFAGYCAGHAGIRGQVTIETASAPETEIAVPEEPAEEADAEPANLNTATAEETDTGLINLNTATAEELQTLPGIGESLSERIVAYREEHGDFLSPDELTNVDGIGTGKYEAVKDRITVE